MNVKILLFPLSLVIAIAVGIFGVQPSIKVALDKRANLDVANQNLQHVRTIVANVSSLSKNLDDNAAQEQLVVTYFPKMQDDERMIDVSNFLASESGILLSSVKMEPIKSELVQSAALRQNAQQEIKEVRDVSPTSAVATTTAMSSALTLVKSSPETRMRSVDATLSVLGRYEQIKAFLEKLYRSNRLNRFDSVLIQVPSQESGKSLGEALPQDILQGIFTVRFSFLPPTLLDEGTYVPIFEKTTFDFKTANELQSMITSTVAPLIVTPSPRPNPFVQ